MWQKFIKNRPSRNRDLLLTISMVFFLLLCFVLLYILKQRTSVYTYDVKRSYEYDFNETSGYIINLTLKDREVKMPHLDGKWDTAFLKLKIKTTFLGNLSSPRIDLKTNESTFSHYFEYGAQGIRYINVSPVISLGKTNLNLKGHHVSLNDQPVELILFKNPNINQAKILVISPHPDDAEIAAYGLYSSQQDSYIVTITSGDAGIKNYDEIYQDNVKHYLKKGKLRVWNSITVPLLGGVMPERTLNLGYFDGTLKEMYLDKSAVVKSKYTHLSDINFYRRMNVSKLIVDLLGVSNWNSLVKDLQYLLNEIEPDIIVTPYPFLDAHPDHKFSSIALFEAIKNLKIKEGYLYLYTNHYTLNEFYPIGNIRSFISLPPYFGPSLSFSGIYSHFLPLEKQNDKLFALEAMNDLRLDTEWRTSYGIIKKAISITRTHILGKDYSYYRRSVRNNELFFIVNIEDIYNSSTFDLNAP